MFTDKRAKPLSGSLTYNLMTIAVALVLTGALVLIGCDSNDVTEEPEVEIAAVAISPDSVSLEVGESVDFSIVGLTASGDTVPNPDLDLVWESTDTEVFTVAEGGVATGQAPGTAFCTVEANSSDAASRAPKLVQIPIGLDSASVRVFAF